MLLHWILISRKLYKKTQQGVFPSIPNPPKECGYKTINKRLPFWGYLINIMILWLSWLLITMGSFCKLIFFYGIKHYKRKILCWMVMMVVENRKYQNSMLFNWCWSNYCSNLTFQYVFKQTIPIKVFPSKKVNFQEKGSCMVPCW